MNGGVGFASFVAGYWLKLGLIKNLSGVEKLELRKVLDDAIKGRISGEKSRKNTLYIVYSILSCPQNLIKLEGYRTFLNKLLEEGTLEDLAPAFVALAITQYPFFYDVLSSVGTELKAGKEVTANRSFQKVGQRYGEKRRVRVAVGYVFQSLVDWGLLARAGRGKYHLKSQVSIQNPELFAIITHGFCNASGVDSVTVDQIQEQSAFAFFKFPVWGNQMYRNLSWFEFSVDGAQRVRLTLSKREYE